MRKILLLLVLGSLLVGMGVFAQSNSDSDSYRAQLTTLAEYLPNDTLFYAAMRTDDHYFDLLDLIVNEISQNADLQAALGIPQMTARQLLEVLFEPVSFSRDVSSWLGESIAVAVPSTIPYTPVLLAEVDNRAAALRFLENHVLTDNRGSWRRTNTPDYVLFTASFNNNLQLSFLLTDDLLAASVASGHLPYAGKLENALAHSTRYHDAINALPAPDYHMIGFADLPYLAVARSRMTRDAQAADAVLWLALARSVGAASFGGTILPNNTLSLDGVVQAGNPKILQALKIPVGDTVQLNPDFAGYVPEDAALVLHGTQLSGLYLWLENAAQGLFDHVFARSYPTLQDAAAQHTNFKSYLEAFTTALLGLDLRSELLPLLENDFAVFIMPNDGKGNIPFDFGIILAVNDAEFSQHIRARLFDEAPLSLYALRNFHIDTRQTTLAGGHHALQFDVARRDDPSNVVLQGAIAGNDQIIVLGTQASVEAALNAEPRPFTLSHALPDASIIAFWQTEALQQLLLSQPNGLPRTTVNALLPLLEDSNVSLSVNQRGDTLFRATLALSQTAVSFELLPTDDPEEEAIATEEMIAPEAIPTHTD